MNLASQIKYYLNKKNWNISSLAKLANIPKQTLSDWVNGTNPRDIKQVKSVADVLEVSLDHLCFGDTEQVPTQSINHYEDEINAGIFEVVLRRVKK